MYLHGSLKRGLFEGALKRDAGVNTSPWLPNLQIMQGMDRWIASGRSFDHVLAVLSRAHTSAIEATGLA